MQSLEEVAICDVYPYERADGEPMNPRDFTTRESAEHIAGLAAQFKANRLNPGQPVMKPILYKEGGIYWIIDGECRVRAMRAIGTERFLAEVYDDLDDAELARVEAAKAMVETDAKLGLTAEEKSRGVQTMLALDIPDEEVAVAARTDAGTVAKARRAEVVAVLADAGVEFVDECPEGFAACRTFSDYRPDLAALDAYVADNAGAGLLAEEAPFGVTLLAPAAEGADEAAQAAAQRKADFQAAYEDGAKARREWLAAHAGDLKSMRRTALALTAFAMESEAVESFEELLGRPIDRTPTELAVAMGWRAAWNMSGWTAWSLMEGGSSVYFNRATVENVTIIYEAMKADGYEPNAAETETYEACMARLGSEE